MTALALPAAARPAPLALRRGAMRVVLIAAGLGVIGLAWWLGAAAVAANPRTSAFADFAPGPTFARFWLMLASGEAWAMTAPSLNRILHGLAIAIAIGVPVGILIGASPSVRTATNLPFQILRMVSPLAWMPIAVLAFRSWDEAIIFLIAVAAVWPVLFATAAGYRRINPAWLRMSRNLGARPPHLLWFVILPAILPDVLTGIRLAVGIAWVVLVPAEFLGVTSGLGYAINDARDTLEYDRLAATVLLIGLIGFALDLLCQEAQARASWIREP
ncbi:ABC transporter permease [Elioraea thermophila]|uniref:ABC transporter permease n=1 Tax=Elioraea thermophila TaxID=2185104 RepID=UPI0018E52A6F|nr:ABC transporter permease [Elioraea thermophila]